MVDTYSRCGFASDGGNAARANREDFGSSVANSGLDSEFFGRDRRSPLVCHVLDWLAQVLLIGPLAKEIELIESGAKNRSLFIRRLSLP